MFSGGGCDFVVFVFLALVFDLVFEVFCLVCVLWVGCLLVLCVVVVGALCLICRRVCFHFPGLCWFVGCCVLAFCG